MLIFSEALKAWGTAGFEAALKEEIRRLGEGALPLQEGLRHSSHVAGDDVNAVVLNVSESQDKIRVKAGLFYRGVVAGSCCADDPTPMCEQTEYCELCFDIDKATAEALVRVSAD